MNDAKTTAKNTRGHHSKKSVTLTFTLQKETAKV